MKLCSLTEESPSQGSVHTGEYTGLSCYLVAFLAFELLEVSGLLS